jgi:hypothetical protein
MSLKPDTSEMQQLRRGFLAAFRRGFLEVVERGVALVKAEAPSGDTEALRKGVRAETDLGGQALKGTIIVSAVREAESAGVATLHLPGGASRMVAVRGTKEFDYARAVAEGTGLHGPKGQVITGRRGGVLLIEVDTPPSDSSYLERGGRTYIVRPRSEGMRANPFDVRAANRLESEVESIIERALQMEGVTA